MGQILGSNWQAESLREKIPISHTTESDFTVCKLRKKRPKVKKSKNVMVLITKRVFLHVLGYTFSAVFAPTLFTYLNNSGEVVSNSRCF